jgi:hypothetical protein
VLFSTDTELDALTLYRSQSTLSDRVFISWCQTVDGA